MIMKHIQYLNSINPRMCEYVGKVSRKLLLYTFLHIGKNPKIRSSDILVEYNQNKLEASEKLFGKKLYFLNPNELIFPLRFRVFLFICMFLNGKYRNLIYCVLMHHTIKSVLNKDAKLYFWNPYSLWHYTFSHLKNTKSVYIHSCSYPLFDADHYYANAFVAKVFGLDKYEFNLVNPDHKYVDDSPIIKIYLTQLSFYSQEENHLRDFAKYLISEKKYKVLVYLHYSDRNRDLSKTSIADIKESVSLEKSIDNLSKKQISFSATSSIGFELLSLGINHYIFHCESSQTPEFDNYAAQSDRFLKIDESFEYLCNKLSLRDFV